MAENYSSIVELNRFDKTKYNVLVPVTTMQAASNLQKIVVSEVSLDCRQDEYNKGPSKDIYYEKSSSQYAITKVGGMKLAAAANISIVDTTSGHTEVCNRCIEVAKATGKARVCGECPHAYDIAVTVTLRVPEPSGGFRMMKATKEVDVTAEKQGMTEKQYNRFLPHRAAMAESKAFMRALRAALGLAGGYSLEELRRPFIIARVVPNLDAPEIKDAVASSYLASMGLLFEAPQQRQALPTASAPQLPQQAAEEVHEYEDEAGYEDDGYQGDDYGYQEDGGYPDDGYNGGYEEPAPAPAPRPTPQQRQAPRQQAPAPQQQWQDPLTTAIKCADCGRLITDGDRSTAKEIQDYSTKHFGRCLCFGCQKKARAAQGGGQRNGGRW